MGFGREILMGVLFVASLSEDNKELNASFTPSNMVARQYNVYELYLGAHPTSSYWIDWGGYYDNPVANEAEFFIDGQYLNRVGSLSECCITNNSIYDEPTAGMIFINVPKHTWLYGKNKLDYRKVKSFLSGPKNPNNPSDDIFDNEHWPVRLETPKITVKLSDVINGLVKYSTFDFALFNNDGYFDNISATNYFNAPASIKKTWKENPAPSDFITIRYGMVETIKINDKTMTVSAADIFRTLEEPVSKAVKNVFPAAVENRDKKLPVIYGQVKIPLIKIDTNKYVAGENISNVINVYDKDGNSVVFTKTTDFIITSSAENIESALVTGNTSNRLGQVVIDVISNKTKIKFINSYWDLTETNNYKNSSPFINIAFTGGTVREAVKDALLSDTVFLIQKNDGKLTLRKWGETYSAFAIENWRITQFPSKDYSDAQKGYFSSCVIHYNYNEADNKYDGVLLYTDKEDETEEKYNKLARKEFETRLASEAAAYNLAVKLSDRFSALKETVRVGLGYDASGINLLDTVNLELKINDRIFSNTAQWIVKEIDPAQDVLTLEAVISPE
jgi:hypothetical protein